MRAGLVVVILWLTLMAVLAAIFFLGRWARNWVAQPLKLQAKEAPGSGGFLEHFEVAAANKCLAQSNKPRTRAEATNKADGSAAQFQPRHAGRPPLRGRAAGLLPAPSRSVRDFDLDLTASPT